MRIILGLSWNWFKNTITIKGEGDDAFRLSSSSGCRYPLEKINMIYQRFQFHLTPIILCWNPNSSMHRANLTIMTIPVLLLAATVAISVMVSDDAFAREIFGRQYKSSSSS